MHIYGLEGLILAKSVHMGGLILRARCSSTANSMISTEGGVWLMWLPGGGGL